MTDVVQSLAGLVRRLAPDLDGQIATAIAEEAVATLHPRLVDAKTVADHFGVSRDWVYENADRLGARIIGAGTKRPRKRFYLHEAAARIDAMAAEPRPAGRNVRKPRPTRRQPRPGFTPSGNPRLAFEPMEA